MRPVCYRCRRPAEACLCAIAQPMPTRIKLIILMHPHERKKVKNGTGRLTALSFEDAEIIEGISFDGNPRLAELLLDAQYAPYLLYPDSAARDLSRGELSSADIGGKRLLVFLVDATWPLAKKMMRESKLLQKLPRLMFTPSAKSRWIIKRQPDEVCLSTLEAVHELMLALDTAGISAYTRPGQLLQTFEAMQAFQVACTHDPTRASRKKDAPKLEGQGYVRVRRPPRPSARALFWNGHTE